MGNPTNDFYRVLHNSVTLKAHPFGLPLTKHRLEYHNIFLLADTGDSVGSSIAMITVMRHVVAAGENKLLLRIIRAGVSQNPLKEMKGHTLYFEVGCDISTYICGGCTDYEGSTGGTHGKILRQVFETVSCHFDVPLVEVTLYEDEGAPTTQVIDQLYEKLRAEEASAMR